MDLFGSINMLGASKPGGLGLGLNFGLGKQQQQPQQSQFQMTEQMLITDLPPDVSNSFVEVFKKVTESPNTDVLEGVSPIDVEIKQLEEETQQALKGSVISLAHQVDYAKSVIKELNKELERSQSDLTNSSHVRTIPSPFITRYVNRLQQRATDLSESLAAYQSRLQPNYQIDSDQTVRELLEQQYNAILRTSTKVVHLRDKLDQIRILTMQKLNTDSLSSSFVNYDANNETKDLISNRIENDFTQFKAERKRKLDKRNANSDLFGNSLLATPPKPAFGLGSGLKSGLGLGTSALGAKK